MYANWSLHRRLSITLAIFGGLVSLALATIIYIASADLEARLIDDTLSAELDDYVARRHRNPQSLPERTATIRAYFLDSQTNDSKIPLAVKKLQAGRHEVTLDGISYRAAVRNVGTQRFIVLYDTSALSQREAGFITLLFISVCVITLVSAFAGRWLARGMIAPINELARRVSELHPEDESTPLAKDFPWLEVRRLAEDFDIYLQRLHRFIEREKLFTGDISHELRTPLAVIHGATELLLGDKELSALNRKRVMRVARGINEMEEITAALLALAREKGDASSASVECDAQTVAQEVIDHYKELFHHKPISIILDIHKPLTLKVDHAILSMVLGNLLRNALSFTEKGQVVIRIDESSIQVEDTGPGLGENNPAQLFKPYVRGHQDSHGSGLGLSLVWRLCELTGWTVSLSNAADGGALAKILLPPDVRKLSS